MSKKEKLLAKLCARSSPKDFPWHDLISLMSYFEFKNTCSGGSHYMFEHTSGFRFSMSKTHPSGILKTYQVRDVKKALRHIGGYFMSILTYKGYTGTIEVSLEDDCLHGQIIFINDIITYEGNTVEDIKTSFEEATDRYLAYCKETGKPADKPYSGTFNVRVGQDLHKKAAEVAYHRGIKLNDFVTQSGVYRISHIFSQKLRYFNSIELDFL